MWLADEYHLKCTYTYTWIEELTSHGGYLGKGTVQIFKMPAHLSQVPYVIVQ